MDEDGQLLGGRYRLGAPLGSGGTGTVYLADDVIGGARVAVKILSQLTTTAALRHRREVLALRVLQVPGVVRLLDEGRSDGRPFIVMEQVFGTPFPGAGRAGWEQLRGPTLALLSTLARVHAAGVIHRDLKPQNVLVDDQGRPILLDFGLARGDTIDVAVTDPDAVAGTPRYQAPEQLTNQPLDPRTDLYAVGLMLYEALAGRPAHPIDSYNRLYAARVLRDAPPLAYFTPRAPAELCRVVDQLLARLPEARPRTALEVLEALESARAGALGAPFPWIGRDAVLRAALDAAHAQRPLDLVGAPGTGRSRTLTEIEGALARAGRRAARIQAGSRPFESLGSVIGPPSGDRVATVEAEMQRRLRETLAGGTVLLVDDADDVDAWSGALLNAVREDGAVIRAWRTAPGPAIRLHPLDATVLRGLFHGPDRLLHLAEDGARALFERTGGVPGRVVAEVSAWVAGGFATWKDGKLTIDRTALDRLEGGVAVRVPPLPGALGDGNLRRGLEETLAWATLAWPHGTPQLLAQLQGGGAWELDMMLRELERVGAVRTLADGRIEPRMAASALHEWTAEQRRAAQLTVASRLPPGAAGRFEHLVAGGDYVAAAQEARVVATRLGNDGYVGRALGVLSQGLYAAREAGDTLAEEALLVQAALAAFAENLGGALQHVRYELARSVLADRLRCLDGLLVAGIASLRGDVAGLRAALDVLDPFPDPALEVWRRALGVNLAFSDGTSAARLAECVQWAEASGSSFLRGRVLGWLGLARYREERYAEAAALHEAALPLKEGHADRLSTMLNAASSWLEAHALTAALGHATEAEALAARLRLGLYEARAAWIRRAVEYRLGQARTVDHDLLDASKALGSPRFAATLQLQEAFVAWRYGPMEEAATLAEEALGVFERDRATLPALVARAVVLSARGSRDPEAWRGLAKAGVALPHSGTVAQILGFVAASGVVWEPAWSDVLTTILGRLTPLPSGAIRTVFTDDELLTHHDRATRT